VSYTNPPCTVDLHPHSQFNLTWQVAKPNLFQSSILRRDADIAPVGALAIA